MQNDSGPTEQWSRFAVCSSLKNGTSWEKRWSVSIMMTIVRENGQLQLQLISVEDIIMFIVDKDFMF